MHFGNIIDCYTIGIAFKYTIQCYYKIENMVPCEVKRAYTNNNSTQSVYQLI